MAITHVATVSATPGVTGGTTAAIDTTGANLLVLSVSWYGVATLSVSDSKGNTWLPLTERIATFHHRFFYAKNAVVGTGHTFTVTASNSYPTIVVSAFSGAASNPFDQETGTANTTSPASTGSITPSAAGALIVSGLVGNMTSAPTVSPAMTTTTFGNAPGVSCAGGSAYLVQGTVAAINPTWSWTGGSTENALGVASFLPATGPSSTRWRLNISGSNNGAFSTLAEVEMASSAGGADLCVGGTATTSNSEGTGFEAEKAFDDNTSTRWAANAVPVWLEYQFASAVAIVEYRLHATAGFPGSTPRDWTLEYWTGSAWAIADSRTVQTGWTAGEVRTYTFHRYRLNISGSNNAPWVTLAEVEMAGVAAGADLCTGGMASASSSESSSFTADKAFDNNAGTRWANVPGLPQWLEYQFASAVSIVEYRIQADTTYANMAPSAWTLETWDGTTWQVIDSRSGQTGWTAGQTRTFSVTSGSATTEGRLSQLPVEVLVGGGVVEARLSQLPVEVLVGTAAATEGRLSQLPLEVLVQSPPDTAARLSQLPLEVLTEAEVTYATEVAVTQVVTELSSRHPGDTSVTQIPLEVAWQQPSIVDVTQFVIERAWKHQPIPPHLLVSQVLIEIIRQPRPPDPEHPIPPEPPTGNCPPADYPFLSAAGEDRYPMLSSAGVDSYPVVPVEDCMDASTFVVNMALNEIGITKQISNLALDPSQEAYAARLVYSDVLDTVLRDHPWKFATEYAALVWLAGTVAAPVNPDWTYTYLLPLDCVRVRRVCDPPQQRRYTVKPIPFDQRADDQGLRDVLMCNEPGGGQLPPMEPNTDPTITIEYTKRLACPAQVNDAQFREAVVMKLAARLAKALARDSKDADRCLRNYLSALPKAQTQHSNDSEPQRPTDAPPDWITGR